jgi:hypothetical protein
MQTENRERFMEKALSAKHDSDTPPHYVYWFFRSDSTASWLDMVLLHYIWSIHVTLGNPNLILNIHPPHHFRIWVSQGGDYDFQ